MAEEVIEEEVIETTPEEDYQSEYDKAWSEEEDELEQLNTEEETTDEIVEEQVEEDSSNEEIVAEDTPIEEVTEDNLDEPSKEFAETLKWNKQEIPVTRDELITLAQKGFDAEKKWRDASISRPMKELVDANNITLEELQTLVDMRSGNAEALAAVAKQAGIDLYDAEDKGYVPVVENKNYELDDVIAEINQNEEIATQMNDYVSSVPKGVKDVLTENPNILRGLNIDMQQGIAQKVMPEVIKQLAINPNQDFVKLYQSVGQTMYSKEEAPKVEKPSRVEPTREEKKRVAVNTRNTAPKKSVTDDYDAAWSDDAHFEAVRARLQGF